jgi:hypothetical protein
MTTTLTHTEATAAQPAAPRAERLALGSGLLFAAVQIAATAFMIYFFSTTHPPVDASPAEAARGFADAAAMVAAGSYLYVLQVPFWLVFLGGLAAVLRRAEGRDGPLTPAVLGAGITIAVTVSLGSLVSATTPTIGLLGGDGAVVKALDGLTPLALALSGFPRAVLLGAVAVLLLRSQIAPRWIGWTGAALVLVSLASTGTLVTPALFPVTALGALLFVAWVAALSVALVRRKPARAVT